MHAFLNQRALFIVSVAAPLSGNTVANKINLAMGDSVVFCRANGYGS